MCEMHRLLASFCTSVRRLSSRPFVALSPLGSGSVPAHDSAPQHQRGSLCTSAATQPQANLGGCGKACPSPLTRLGRVQQRVTADHGGADRLECSLDGWAAAELYTAIDYVHTYDSTSA